MKAFQLRGYPANYYFVKTFDELLEIAVWSRKNDVKCLHESSGIHGYGFTIQSKIDWFMLKWC